MHYYLWEMRPYFRQVAGQLVLGSIAGIIMNTAVVLPAILLGQAIDAVRAFERGEVAADAVGWAAGICDNGLQRCQLHILLFHRLLTGDSD